jgi:hypothetical protein
MNYIRTFNEFFSASLVISTASAIILFKIIYSVLTKKTLKKTILNTEELKKTNDSIVLNVLDIIKNLTTIDNKNSNIFEITEDETSYILTKGHNLRINFPTIKLNKKQKLLTYNDHDISINDQQYNEILSVINGYM